MHLQTIKNLANLAEKRPNLVIRIRNKRSKDIYQVTGFLTLFVFGQKIKGIGYKLENDLTTLFREPDAFADFEEFE